MIKLFDGKDDVKELSILCMFRNNQKYLENFFFKMVDDFEKMYDVNFHFFIIENNSTDNTKQLLKDFFNKKSKKSKLLLFNLKKDYKNIGDGRNYDRLKNLAKIRNKLIDNIIPLDSKWSVFIDSNIYFKPEILSELFAIKPSENNIGMLSPYSQQLLIPEVHKVPEPTLVGHFYDTFSFFNTDNKTFWPYCGFKKCKICKRNDVEDREAEEEKDITDVKCVFGGFSIIENEILNNPKIRWDTVSYDVKKTESLCEHYLFCDRLKLLTNKRIVVCQNVDKIYRTI
jgi:glycosyltransferase involved in cell wall biosynthesis